MDSLIPLVPQSAINFLSPPNASKKSSVPSYFFLGRFKINPYTIRLNFDQIKGFYVHVRSRQKSMSHVELVAPFAHVKNISRRQLQQLAATITPSYTIRLMELGKDHFKIEFIPKLLGGGQCNSKTSKPNPNKSNKEENKYEESKHEENKEEEEKSEGIVREEDFLSLFANTSQFITKKDVIPPGELSKVTIPSTEDLALIISQTQPRTPIYQRLEKLAIDVIDTYVGRSLKTPELLKEVSLLAYSGSKAVSQMLIKVIFEEFNHSSLLDAHLLKALGDAIRATKPEHLDPDNLVAILTSLQEKNKKLFTQEESKVKQYLLLHALANILEVMGDANVKKLSYDNLQDPLYVKLNDLSQDSDWRISAKATYAKEALLRIGHDKSKFMLFFEKLVSFGKGLSNVVNVITDENPTALIEAYENFKKALHRQGKEHSWYEKLRFFLILIREDCFKTLTDTLKEPIVDVPKGEYTLLLRGTVQVLMETIAYHKDADRCVSLIQILTSLYLEEDQWKSFSPYLKEIVTQKKGREILAVQTVKIGILQQFERWAVEALEAKVREAAKLALEKIKNKSVTEEEKKLLKEAGLKVMAKLQEDPINFQPFLRTSSLIDATFQRPKSLQELTDMIRSEYDGVKKEEIRQLLPTYVPSRGSIDGNFKDPKAIFILEEKVREFLRNPTEKVLLLLGGAGSGKTSFGYYLAAELAKKRGSNDHIPLFIRLGSLENPGKTAIEEGLAEIGIDGREEVSSLRTNYRFVFILDGYDEMGKLPNLYRQNHLGEKWKAKVIISCRDTFGHLEDKDIENQFMPSKENAHFRKIWVAPFTPDDIDTFLQRYISSRPKKYPAQWPLQKYQDQIQKIPGLLQLITNPFLLHIAADVLPAIVEKYERSQQPKKRLDIFYYDLLKHFMERWIGRIETQLRDNGTLDTFMGNYKDEVENFCKKLAAMMSRRGITVVENTSEWKEFFSDESPTREFRRGAPLKGNVDNDDGKKNNKNYLQKRKLAFFHKSIQEYYLARESYDEMMKKKEDEESDDKKEASSIMHDTPLTSSSLGEKLDGKEQREKNSSIPQTLKDDDDDFYV